MDTIENESRLRQIVRHFHDKGIHCKKCHQPYSRESFEIMQSTQEGIAIRITCACGKMRGVGLISFGKVEPHPDA